MSLWTTTNGKIAVQLGAGADARQAPRRSAPQTLAGTNFPDPMTDVNRDYEIFVRDITAALLKADGLTTVKVNHDIQVQGIARNHQIDVYWEYRLGGVLHRVIINCKNYKTTVEVGDVEGLAGVLHDMPGVRGVIVTTLGFQKGAIDYAKVHGIGLKVIRPPVDKDWEGRVREIRLNIITHAPELLETRIGLNAEWCAAQPNAGHDLIGTMSARADLMRVRNAETGVVEDIHDLWTQAMAASPTEPGTENSATLRWTNAFLECEGLTPRRIDFVFFRWRIRVDEPETITVRKDAKAIVRDAINGTLLFVDPEGEVGGDTEMAG